MRPILLLLVLLAAGPLPVAAQAPGPAAAPFVGKPIVSVSLEIEQRETRDPQLLELLDTKVGKPLSMSDVRETLGHFYSLGRFQDVQVEAENAPGGVALRYLLVPLHSVAGISLRGALGLSEGDLRNVITERYGATPPAGRADAAARTLAQYLAGRGYLGAHVKPALDVRHDPDRTILVFDVEAGARATIGTAQVVGGPPGLTSRFGLTPGTPYDPEALDRRINSYVESLHKRGFYEATADHTAQPRDSAHVVDITVDVRSGPLVKLRFEGDSLPASKIDDLVPVKRDASVDTDLLEDSETRIKRYLMDQGYWKAEATYVRATEGTAETITFTVHRGKKYSIDGVEVSGNAGIPIEKLRPLVRLKKGDVFVQPQLEADISAIKSLYLSDGYMAAIISSALSEVPTQDPQTGLVAVRIVITEGPRTTIGAVRFDGNSAVNSESLRDVTRLAAGAPYFPPTVISDRDSIQREYLNRGYESVTVEIELQFAADRSSVAIVYQIHEGPLAIVDQVIIIGNTETKEETIRRELRIRPGQPLGMSDIVESQQRLTALGLFRRVRISEVSHGAEARRDVIVSVEEAERTTISYGAGAEIGTRLITGPTGIAEQTIDIAPRGSFEVTRRNLWGGNRSIDFFVRGGLRQTGASAEEPGSSSYGLNEYRAVGTFRAFSSAGSRTQVSMQAFAEQGIRTSFNYRRQAFDTELLRPLSPTLRLSARYNLSRTDLFDERIPPEEQVPVDRLYPQVRLSSVIATFFRDTRDDALDPTGGKLLSVEPEFAAKAIGSQVGFAKLYLQGYFFRPLPSKRRLVLATAARLGLANAFSGAPETITDGEALPDLPASERFFAGGSTTVRGFALDTLGAPETITPQGFPRGGNAMIILNGELRATVWRYVGVVGFVDAGNVFGRVQTFDFGELRLTPGLGVRLRSPLGPIRLDLGFKTRRREIAPGQLEALTAFHISIGQAF